MGRGRLEKLAGLAKSDTLAFFGTAIAIAPYSRGCGERGKVEESR
jgi:hypothetical protein